MEPHGRKYGKEIGGLVGEILEYGRGLWLSIIAYLNVPLYMFFLYYAPKNVIRKMDVFKEKIIMARWQNFAKIPSRGLGHCLSP
jgi:hypothetical protein